MSVIRQFDWLGELRVDVPFLKSVESSIAADFDLGFGRILGGLQPMIVRGFEISAAASAIGKNSVDLQLNTANSALIHPLATESGSIFFVPSGASLFNFTPNDQLRGSFTASSINYVGVDLLRSTSSPAATATTDTAKFIDPGTNQEIIRQIPLGKILDYVIVISTISFDNTPSVLPLCKITTNGSNIVTAIQDCRYRPSRLATGGSFPAIQSSYPWPQGREENTTGDVFYGGDKAINSYKEWQDAIMSRVWEIGGGKYWYSPTADRNIRMTRGGTTFTDGEWFEWDGTNLHWRGLKMVFDNSNAGVYFNTITDQLIDAAGAYGTTATNLVDGDCIYVDLTRNSNGTIVAIKAQISTLGTPITPGSRYILAWRVGAVVYTRDSGFPVGATFTVASTTALGIVKLSHTPTTPLAPIVLSDGALNAALGVVGLDANKRAVITATAGTALATTGQGTGAGGDFTGGATGAAAIFRGFEELVEVASPPGTPASTHCVLYLTNNGIVSPNKRQRLVVKFQDGSTVTIAESNLF